MGAVAAEVAAWGEEWASPPKRASSVPVGNAFWRVRFAVVYGTCFWHYQAACNASALLKCGMCAPHPNFLLALAPQASGVSHRAKAAGRFALLKKALETETLHAQKRARGEFAVCRVHANGVCVFVCVLLCSGPGYLVVPVLPGLNPSQRPHLAIGRSFHLLPMHPPTHPTIPSLCSVRASAR